MNSHQMPIIRIEASHLLYNNVSVQLHKTQTLYGNRKILSFEEVSQIAETYTAAWKPYEERIITGLLQVTGLEFRRNIIDVHIAPYFRTFSFPLIVGTGFDSDVFIDVLTHEIIHSILWDNTSVPLGFDFRAAWKTILPAEISPLARVHILVHAVHKQIYLDILKEEHRYIRELETIYSSDAEAYQDAWEYVHQHGDVQILDSLKKLYKNASN